MRRAMIAMVALVAGLSTGVMVDTAAASTAFTTKTEARALTLKVARQTCVMTKGCRRVYVQRASNCKVIPNLGYRCRFSLATLNGVRVGYVFSQSETDYNVTGVMPGA